MPVALKGRGYRPALAIPTAEPDEFFRWYTGLEVPDPITFIVGEKWLNRPNLYPRQATLIKVIFLREDLFTPYDYDVVAEWEENFKQTGNNGIVPNILWKMRWLKEQGYKWFREVLLVMGRRAGKGHIAGLCMAYVLWNYMAKGDPQGHYGVDRDKKLTCLVFAGKREQAKATVWRDLVNVVTGSSCFAPYISQTQAERLSVYAPHDMVRIRKQMEKGIFSELDMATFEIVPKESTMMAGRGPASFMQAYDEMAHVVASGANRSAEEVYTAATPSLDQFGKDGFIIEPSSPWQMMGQFYENYQNSIAVDEDGVTPTYPEILMIQLASWDIYVDWERAADLPLFPEGFYGEDNGVRFEEPSEIDREFYDIIHRNFAPLRGAIQTFDDQMQRLKKANPETFAVERESKFATALDAYLNSKKVKEIFDPWLLRPERYGRPELLMQERGLLIHNYKGHGDPSKSNANFGFALAHPEVAEDGTIHCVFDLLHHFSPQDYEDNIINYEDVEEWIWDNVLSKFYPDEMTFDQWNSASTIQRFTKRIRGAEFPKRVTVFEKTATAAYNWQRSETSKTAINMGWVHAPYYEQLDLELRFLQEKNGKVDHPTIGPVQTKDVADCAMECIQVIVGDQVNNFLQNDLSNLRPGGSQQGGFESFPGMSGDPLEALSGFGSARGRGSMGGGGMGRGRRGRG